MATNPSKEVSETVCLLGIGERAPREFRLDGEKFSIGSGADNDLVIADPTVSRRHAAICRRSNTYLVSDLGSTNGTFVNGRPIRQPTTLSRGDELRLGAVRMVFVADFPAARSDSGIFSSKRVRLTGAIVAVLALFALGFATVEYVFNWSALEELGPSQSKSLADKRSVEIGVGSLHGKTSGAGVPKAAASDHAGGARVSKATVGGSAGETPAGPSAAGGLAPAWVQRINYYRAMVGLQPVVEDAALDRGDSLHARYLVKTYGADIRKGRIEGAAMHSEESSSPWFTPEGLKAARSSDISAWAGKSGRGGSAEVIDNLVSIPFHRLWILDPALRRVGYGEYCESGACASALDILNASDMPSLRAVALKEPVRFPAAGSTVGLRSLEGEWPDPLSSCPGYIAPAGLAVTLQLGNMITAALGSYRLTRHGEEVESCGFDAQSYRNPDPAAQARARGVLHELGTVVVIPRKPLRPGRYEVSLVVAGQSYDWSFTVR